MSLVNLFSKALVPSNVNSVQSTPLRSSSNSNPFGNPFISNNTTDYYGKNKPVRGGYFAGYYNGKPNIVGKHLFLEV